MNILVLGGTQFVGRAIVNRLVKNPNNIITLSNRGKSAPDLFKELELIKADREADDMQAITSRDWDVVVDVSSFFPDSLADLTKKLTGRIGKYIYISTCSVYRFGTDNPPYDETMTTLTCEKDQRTNPDMSTYGERKMACEIELLENHRLEKVIFRPSVIYGPHDLYDRHYHWLYRAKQDDKFIVPESPIGMANYTWLDDLTRLVEEASQKEMPNEIYNTATHDPLTLFDLVSAMKDVLGSRAEQVQWPVAKLELNSIKPGVDLPLWFGKARLNMSTKRVTEDFSFDFETLDQTFKKWSLWYDNKGWPSPTKYLDLEKEKTLLSN
ncbi:MAG: 2'-hydroxyisoflavone reductase [Limisphaerales bacterium]|jgi:2'-hydroxyisoflavone reductase